MEEDEKEIVVVDGIYSCPVCNSKRITEYSQCTLQKQNNVNTGKLINPNNGKGYMSNREKARDYNSASIDGVGCWYYECRKCGWNGELLVEQLNKSKSDNGY